MSAIEKKSDPYHVLSTVSPDPIMLARARIVINMDPAIRDLMQEKSVGEGTWTDRVGLRLNECWGGEHGHVAWECAQYLWDEAAQLPEGIYFTSKETGRVIGIATEADIYTPEPIERIELNQAGEEVRHVVQRGPQIRPELLAGVAMWFSDAARERRILAHLVSKAALAADDPRLLAATRAGRSSIAADLAKLVPAELFASVTGAAAAFVGHLRVVSDDTWKPEDRDPAAEVTVSGTCTSDSIQGIQDQMSMSLRVSPKQRLATTIPQGWVRDIARKLSRGVPLTSVTTAALKPLMFAKFDLVIAPPSLYRTIVPMLPRGVKILPVEGANLMGIYPGVMGTLVVPSEMALTSTERYDRWTVETEIGFKIYVRLTDLEGFEVTDLAVEAFA